MIQGQEERALPVASTRLARKHGTDLLWLQTATDVDHPVTPRPDSVTATGTYTHFSSPQSRALTPLQYPLRLKSVLVDGEWTRFHFFSKEKNSHRHRSTAAPISSARWLASAFSRGLPRPYTQWLCACSTSALVRRWAAGKPRAQPTEVLLAAVSPANVGVTGY